MDVVLQDLAPRFSAMLLLTDYRTGPLGRISLETPTTRQVVLQSAVVLAQLIQVKQKSNTEV